MRQLKGPAAPKKPREEATGLMAGLRHPGLLHNQSRAELWPPASCFPQSGLEANRMKKGGQKDMTEASMLCWSLSSVRVSAWVTGAAW
jgi:hypothetical protein